ncbi:MAG: thioredoxin family protein [Ferruginibacter sp.]
MQNDGSILKEVKKETGDSVTIIKVDVDKSLQPANEYHAQGVPILILFKNGKHLRWQSGLVPKGGRLGVIKKFTL